MSDWAIAIIGSAVLSTLLNGILKMIADERERHKRKKWDAIVRKLGGNGDTQIYAESSGLLLDKGGDISTKGGLI